MVLQSQKEGEEGEGAEGAARNQQGLIVALPVQLSTRDRHAADQP
jgi:hypothetical protein